MRQTATPQSSAVDPAHRRSVPCLCTLLLVFASAAQLNAAADPPVGIRELARLTAVSANLIAEAKAIEGEGRYGFAESGHCLLGASIAPGQSATIRVKLEAGRAHSRFVA